MSTVCVFVVYTGMGTVNASPGEALKDYQCLCIFLSIYNDALDIFHSVPHFFLDILMCFFIILKAAFVL